MVRAAFRRLDAEDLLPSFIELPEQCTYHFAEGEALTVHRDLEATAANVGALWPTEVPGLRHFYAEAEAIYRAAGEPYLEAPLEGAADYMVRVGRRGLGALLRGARLGSLADLGARHFRAEALRQFVGRFATYAGASPYRASAAFALIPHLERAFGVYHAEGGLGALAAALAKAVARQGVELRFGQRATWRPEGSGFLAGPEGDLQPFDAVVVNANPMASLGRSREPLSLSGYVLLLSVKRRLSLPHHTVCFTRDYRREFDQLFSGAIPEDPTLYLCHPAATDASMAPGDQSGLFMMSNAPALALSGNDDWTDRAAALREHCLDRLQRLCPEVQRSEVEILGERTPVDIARRGAPGGSIYGFLPHGRLGPFRRPAQRGPHPGLFFAGGGTHPGGGVPLVMLSGHFAALMAAQHLGARA